MRRSDHPSRPSAITCCRFSALKTLAISAAGAEPTAQVNVSAPGAALAGFQVSINGRFWVSTEVEAIESAGGRVTKHAEAHVLAGFFFVSGEIERVTSYEAGFVGHHTVRDGHTVPDPLILDERFLAARGRGRGVSVLSACSHAGVVNAALGALGAFGGEPIDVILGGYHLAGEGMEPRIEPTVHDLANRVRPRVVAPGHCTGWRAKAALAHTFAPGNYGPSVVGSLYALRAT